MKTARIQIIISLVIFSVAGFLFWMQFKPPPPPPKTEFQIGQEAFKAQIQSDQNWYQQANAHGLSYNVFMPLEIAATNATTQKYIEVFQRPDYRSLSTSECKQIADRIKTKSDEARQVMRASYYTKPFKPDW